MSKLDVVTERLKQIPTGAVAGLLLETQRDGIGPLISMTLIHQRVNWTFSRVIR